MGEQLAYELVPLGIDVTIIQPGGYPTRVWVNRNALTAALKERTDAGRIDAYPLRLSQQLHTAMGREDGSGRSADPLDVPRIAITPSPKSSPCRRSHQHAPVAAPRNGFAALPGSKPHQRHRDQPGQRRSGVRQVAWLGGTALGPLVKASRA